MLTETKVFVAAAVVALVACALVVAGVAVLAGPGWALITAGGLLVVETVVVAGYLLGGSS